MQITVSIETEVIPKVVVEVMEEKEKEVEIGKEKEKGKGEKAVQGNTVEVIVEIIEELIREMMIIIKDMKNQRIQEELIKNHIRNFVV